MRMQIIAALCAASFALPVAAEDTPCALNGGEAVALFAPVHKAFLEGDFDTVVELVTPLMPEQRASVTGMVEDVRSQFPARYSSCELLVQRKDLALMQEVSAFHAEGQLVPTFFFLQAAPAGGEMQIMQFYFSTRLTDVLAKLQ